MMTIIQKNINEIKPYKKKLRNSTNSVKYVANSIAKFGFQQPIVIDRDGTIVAGTVRYLAAKELGIDDVPCVIADDLTEDEIKRYRIADNKTAEISRWDYLGLAKEIDSISGEELLDFGFSDNEVKLLGGLGKDISADPMEEKENTNEKGAFYQPNVDPKFSTREVTENDIKWAEMREATMFTPKERNTKVYICPKCGRRFEARI